MKFWDSSALLPLVLAERRSASMRALYRRDPDMFIWWATRVEVSSALARRERTGESSPREVSAGRQRWARLVRHAQEVEPDEQIRALAQRLLQRYALRAADSLQLAAALVLRSEADGAFEFVTLDAGLASAATAEGFSVLPVPAPQATAGEPS